MIDLAELWKRFLETQQQAEQYAAEHKIYEGGYQPVNQQWVEREVEKQMKEYE